MELNFDETLNKLLETSTIANDKEIPTYMLIAGVLVEKAKQGNTDAVRLIIERLDRYVENNSDNSK